MKALTQLLIVAFYTVFIQNLVLSSGLGISEAIRISSKPGTFGKIAVMISGFSVITSAICGFIDMIPAVTGISYAMRALIYGAVLAVVFAVVAVFAKFLFKASDKFLGTLGIAALNTLVFALPHINNHAAYSFAGSIGAALCRPGICGR